jgi:hypothetical protein
VALATQERPPQILQIYRDSVKEGGEATFKAIEEVAARACAELEFPHPHLAIESLTGPKEVWYLGKRLRGEDGRRSTSISEGATVAKPRIRSPSTATYVVPMWCRN